MKIVITLNSGRRLKLRHRGQASDVRVDLDNDGLPCTIEGNFRNTEKLLYINRNSVEAITLEG
jgi:hypothetical protein